MQAENALLLVRSHDSHASCEQHVLRTTNVPLSVIMLYPSTLDPTGDNPLFVPEVDSQRPGDGRSRIWLAQQPGAPESKSIAQ
jgi:hypothetical protein